MEMETVQPVSNKVRGEKRVPDLTFIVGRLQNARRLNAVQQQRLADTKAAEPQSSSTSSIRTSSPRLGGIFQVVVSGIRGEKVVVDLCNNKEQMKSITVQQLKEKISQKLPSTAGGLDDLRLIFVDKALDEDSRFLSGYGIIDKSVIHLVNKVPGGGCPLKGDGGMGDKDDKHRMSMERLPRM